MEIWLPVLCGLLAGAALVWFVFAAPARSRADRAEAGLEAERKAHAVRLEEIEKARGESESRFAALAAEALGKNNKSFLDLADRDLKAREEAVAALVKPIREELKKVEARAQELERSREGAYRSVTEQVKQLAEGQSALRSETGRLVQALRRPQGAGRWGEHQLRNVLEMAGMMEHVDFDEQANLPGENGALRPDVVIHLPGGKSVVVDAKTPLQAYLDAVEAKTEEERATHLDALARHVRSHVRQLADKRYWDRLSEGTDFVVMFIPGDAFVAAAFERDPALFEEAVRNRVLIATPITLIALVKVVAYGWQQEKLAENARAVAETGRELYERVKRFGGRMEDIGKSLRQAVERYNRGVGTLERQVLPSARKLEGLGVVSASDTIAPLEQLETEPRSLQAPELAGPAEGAGNDYTGRDDDGDVEPGRA
ncbi:MAG: DNA recombination protein RmuC [Alphaproteobacteria bacterium]|nr:DNA recombination protein RmuC [Alphaproteobacteria bacterium]